MKSYSITTKKGDKGRTGLLDGSRVIKTNIRPEAYGTLDEAAAFIGLARSHTDLDEIADFLLLIQNHIYYINSELACPTESLHLLERTLTSNDLKSVEEKADAFEKKLNLPRKFVLYGETVVSAYLDVSRAVIRRAERRIEELNAQEEIKNSHLRAYINRLSDALFILARYDEWIHKGGYRHPEKDLK